MHRKQIAGLLLALCLLPGATPMLAAVAANSGPLRVVREGTEVTVQVSGPSPMLTEGDTARIEVRFRDAANGEPLRGLRPAVWLDGLPAGASASMEERSCRERVNGYLRGNLNSRPLVDLNGYFLLVMNRDPTISVIDPIVGISGRTNLLTSIILPQPAADWIEQETRRQLLVSLPRANQVAVIDAETFKLKGLVNTGKSPLRVQVQQAGTLGFSANDGDGTITVLDLAAVKPVTTLVVGSGHHELALVERKARLFATNQGDRTISVIDTASLKVLHTVPVEGMPTSLADVPASGAVAVAHGVDGRISLLADDTGSLRRHVRLGVEVNALATTPDGRSLLALATEARTLLVLDPADLSVRHRVSLPGRPYQWQFTRDMVHLRQYDTERVTTVSLSALARRESLAPGGYAAGTGGPRPDSVVVMASGLASTPDGLAALVVNPADAQIHYYMEGMNAPAGSFRSYGHPPQAVHATDRALKEKQPGDYSADVRLPLAGRLSVVVRTDQPRLAECFDFEVARSPQLEMAERRLKVALLDLSKVLDVKPERTLQLQVRDEQDQPVDLPAGTQLVYYRAPGTDRRTVGLVSSGAGRYDAVVRLDAPGAWYLQLATTLKLTPPQFSLIVRAE